MGPGRCSLVKKEAGLFEDPYLEKVNPEFEFGSTKSHEVARKLAAESFVALKTGKKMYIEPGMKVFVTGPAADDTGVLCGGWTYFWQGVSDKEYFGSTDTHVTQGNSIVDALKEAGVEVVTDKSQSGSCSRRGRR